MNTPLLTWIVVISSQVLLIIAFIIHHFRERNSAKAHAAAIRQHSGSHRHIITVGSEREEFFCPGDTMRVDSHDWNNQDCD